MQNWCITVLLLSGMLALTNISHSQPVLSEADVHVLLKDGRTEALMQRITGAYYSADQATWDAVGNVLACTITEGRPLLDALQRDNERESLAMYAELLLRCARGADLPQPELKDRQIDEMPTQELGERAVALLQDPDPCIRALADWAIDVRVGILNGGRTKVWPEVGQAGPAWYRTWLHSLTSEFKLEADYTRQVIGLRMHRTPAQLAAYTQTFLTQLERRMTEYDGILSSGRTSVVDTLRKQVAAMRAGGDMISLRKRCVQIRKTARDLILGDPAIDFGGILFATRHCYHDGPNITAGAKSYIIKPGGDILIKQGFEPGDPVKPLINGQLALGHSRGIELWWDADRVVFAWAEQPDYFKEVMWESDQGFNDKDHGLSKPAHLYEINTDGTGLRQLTGHDHYSDVEPAYLPNGDIVFCSERSGYGSQCSGHFFQNKRIVNLYTVKPDGSGLRAISNNKDFDRYPHVLDNGQIIFTRWEYQERHLWQVHNVWLQHPDGTMSDPIFKEHINGGPMALRDTRHIPGSHKLVSISCGHHEFAQGAVTIIDNYVGTNDPAGMRHVTPGISKREGGLGKVNTVEQGGVQDAGGLYQQPYALSEYSFLVSYSWHLPNSDPNTHNAAVYYIDVWGNKELIHREPVLSSVCPIPFKKRTRPLMIAGHIKPELNYATVYMNDVYSGVPEFQPGEIRYLRIGHHTEWPTMQTGNRVIDYNHLHYTPSGSWSRTLGLWTWSPARVIGEVLVEPDGSAYFKVPANLPLYFQALDENHMELRRMRSFITFQPGETRGCTGCHETRDEAPLTVVRVPQAVRRAPSMPVPPSWGDTILPDYEEHIQPIMAENCASCHGETNPAGGLEFSSRKIDGQYQSYRTMFGLSAHDRTPVQETWSHKLVFPENPDPLEDRKSLELMQVNEYPGQLVYISDRHGDMSVSKVRQFGAGASPLTLTLTRDPLHLEKVHMPQQEWIDLVTWIDLNAPYWGTFVDKEPMRDGHAPKRIRYIFPPPFSLKAH